MHRGLTRSLHSYVAYPRWCKTLVAMIGAAVADAGTTILVLPMVALLGDMLRRFHQGAIQPLILSVDYKRSALLVIAKLRVLKSLILSHSSQQAETRSHCDRRGSTHHYCQWRLCTAQLGYYIRQMRKQSVWLTVTLPPVMEEEFIEHNKQDYPGID